MSFVTGFAQGFSESVQAAIEEEQKSIDDLFKTQFTVRLKRRMDDLSKDRENLAEAAKNLETYRQLLPDNDLFKAGQLYKAAGGDHTAYIKRITDIRNAGGDPFAQLQFTEGDLGEATAQDVARSLVVAPTALPFSEMPSAGGLLGALAKQFGADAQHSPYARKQMERLQGRLQAVAPLPEAGQQFDIPSVTQTGTMLTPTEGRRAQLEQIQIDAGQQNLKLARAIFPSQVALKAQEVEAGIDTQQLNAATFDARVKFINDKAKLNNLELISKNYEVDNIMNLGRQEALLQIEKLRMQIDRIKNPADLEEMQAVVTGNIFKVQDKLLNTDPDNVPETERLKSMLSSLQRQDMRLTASIGKMEALTGTPSDPLKNFSAANTAYGKALNNELANSKLAGMPGIVLKSTGDGGVTLQFAGDPKGGALEELRRVERIAKRNFFFSMADGVNPDGSPRFVTEAARRSVELNIGMRDYRRINSYYMMSQAYSGASDYFNKNKAIQNEFSSGALRLVKKEGRSVPSDARLKLIDRLINAFGIRPRAASIQIDEYQKNIDAQSDDY